jgi:hypothetical protein
MVCLLQLSTVNAKAVREDQDRRVATDVAVRFAVALTTFDYAHPNVQVLQVAALSWQVVQGRVAASIDDIAATKASSVGNVSESIVLRLIGFQAEVLVRTSQVVTSTYTAGTRMAGLVDVTVRRSSGRWMVSDYRWLVAPSNSP